MTDERISEKMSPISHTGHDLPEFNNPDHLHCCVENNIDSWNRLRKRKIVPLDSRLPGWLIANKGFN